MGLKSRPPYVCVVLCRVGLGRVKWEIITCSRSRRSAGGCNWTDGLDEDFAAPGALDDLSPDVGGGFGPGFA